MRGGGGREHLFVVAELEPGEIEVGQVVAMADIEEEVCRTPVVPVLEQFDEREFEKVLIEGDGPLDITGEQREMVEAPRRRRRSLAPRTKEPSLPVGPLLGPVDVASRVASLQVSFGELYPRRPCHRQGSGGCRHR